MRLDYPLGSGLTGFIKSRAGWLQEPNVASLVKGWLCHCRFQSHFALSQKEAAREELVRMEGLPGLPPALELECLSDACILANQFSLWDEMKPALERLRVISKDTGNLKGSARADYFLGAICVNDGDYQQAVGHYQRALAAAQGIGDDALRAEVLNDLGFCHRRMADDALAITYYRESLAIREGNGDLTGQAESLNNIGLVLCGQGEHGQAEEALNRALAIEEKTGDKVGVGYTLLNLSHLASHKGEHARAEELCRRALVVRREIGDQLGLGYCYTNLAHWAKVRGQTEEAMALMDQAIGAFSVAGEIYSLTEARLQKVRYLLDFKMREEAGQELARLEPLLDREPADRQLKCFRELRAALGVNVT